MADRLTRKELDGALQEALQGMLKDISEKVSVEVRAAVQDIKVAIEASPRRMSDTPRQGTGLAPYILDQSNLTRPSLYRKGSGTSLDSKNSNESLEGSAGSTAERESKTDSKIVSFGDSERSDSRPAPSPPNATTELLTSVRIPSTEESRYPPGYETYAPLADSEEPPRCLVPRALSEENMTRRRSSAMKALRKFQKQRMDAEYAKDCAWSCRAIVRHPKFELVVGFFVMLNCVFLGLEVDMAASSLSGQQMPRPLSLFMAVTDFMFCVLFTVEICMRICVYGRRTFFAGEDWQWNVFDTIVVSLQAAEEMMEMSGMGHYEFLRIARILRILRMVRLVHLFSELRTRVSSIVESLSSLVMTLVLLVMIIFCFSVLFTELSVVAQTEKDIDELNTFFGSIPRTALTLLECITGGMNWNNPLVTLFDHIGVFSVLCFIFYISFGVFVLLNVIMGVFIDKAIKVAQEDEELQVACAITGAFLGDDLYSGEEVTWEVFEKKLEDPTLQECFAVLNVDIAEARVLFELLDADHSGSVDAQEIVEGCLKLKGNAKALDMSLMIHMQGQVADRLERHVDSLERKIVHVDDNLIKLCTRIGYDASLVSCLPEVPLGSH